MDVRQSMYFQHRHAWKLIFMVYGGISVANASNPTNTPDSSKVESVSVQKSSDHSVTIKSVRTGDHELDLERSLQEFDEKLLRELEEARQERQESARQKAAVRSDAELEAESESESQAGEVASGESESQAGEVASGESESQAGEVASGESVEDIDGSNNSAGSNGRERSEEESLPGLIGTSNSADPVESSSPTAEGSATTKKVVIPDGNDDDVIARQLREAAEAETDPKVKEKLWIEYRKYKNQQSPGAAPPTP